MNALLYLLDVGSCFAAGFGLSRGCGWLVRRWAADEIAAEQSAGDLR